MKYIVLKREDCDKYLDEEHGNMLLKVLEHVGVGRLEDKKCLDNKYLVLNIDTPYAAQIYAIMHEHGHTPCADCAEEKKCPPYTYCQPDCSWLKLRDRMLQIIDHRRQVRAWEMRYVEGR